MASSSQETQKTTPYTELHDVCQTLRVLDQVKASIGRRKTNDCNENERGNR